jgi:methylase of polypeptide subunit release factors
MPIKGKIEYGDFQTPEDLAALISAFIKKSFQHPSVIIEPTCGTGRFIKAALSVFNGDARYYGFDINRKYIGILNKTLKSDKCFLEASDFFKKDWKHFFSDLTHEKILIIGNPPWVTNSALSVLNSSNLPDKSNFQHQKGFAAKTGKGNFDIAEWILIKIIESVKNQDACTAMLCKTATARKVLKYLWENDINIHDSSLHLIDAKKYFDVSVGACLFVTHSGKSAITKHAAVYSELNFESKISTLGIYHNDLIADADDYRKYQFIEGTEHYKWRSGIKHDASKVMELFYDNGCLINGFGKKARIEEDYVYPLLKSSDIGNGRLNPQKYVILTQKKVGDNTLHIRQKAPKLWAYLDEYADILDKRKSIIYRKRPRFSVFGIGDYSFSPWKVAISGLYKSLKFSVIGSVSDKPIMVDDTCYFISCFSENEAYSAEKLLNSEICQKFLKSLIFSDAKRPITIDILKRIDLKKLSAYFEPGFTGLTELPIFE